MCGVWTTYLRLQRCVCESFYSVILNSICLMKFKIRFVDYCWMCTKWIRRSLTVCAKLFSNLELQEYQPAIPRSDSKNETLVETKPSIKTHCPFVRCKSSCNCNFILWTLFQSKKSLILKKRFLLAERYILTCGTVANISISFFLRVLSQNTINRLKFFA